MFTLSKPFCVNFNNFPTNRGNFCRKSCLTINLRDSYATNATLLLNTPLHRLVYHRRPIHHYTEPEPNKNHSCLTKLNTGGIYLGTVLSYMRSPCCRSHRVQKMKEGDARRCPSLFFIYINIQCERTKKSRGGKKKMKIARLVFRCIRICCVSQWYQCGTESWERCQQEYSRRDMAFSCSGIE